MKTFGSLLVVLAGLGFVACDGGNDVGEPPELNDENETFGSGSDDDDGDGDTDGSDSASDSETAPPDDDGETAPPDDDGNDSRPDSDSDSAGETEGDSAGETEGDSDSEGEVDECDSSAFNLAPMGFASASSVFDPWFGAPYDPELSIDGSTGTAWFSGGPETDGTSSTFEWYVQHDHCLDEIVIRGNAEHEEEGFREGFGFESLLVEVFDTSGDAIYSETHELSGTPDPDVRVDLAGQLGHRVLLSFSGHEAPDCGGFTELTVTARETL